MATDQIGNSGEAKILRGSTVLVVEDDEIMLEVLCEFFADNSIRVFGAANGKMALEQLATQKIDLVFTDIQMPVMNGLELLKQIRSKDPYEPKVLFATGESQLTESAAIAQGAAGLIHKPFQMENLIKKINSIAPNFFQVAN